MTWAWAHLDEDEQLWAVVETEDHDGRCIFGELFLYPHAHLEDPEAERFTDVRVPLVELALPVTVR